MTQQNEKELLVVIVTYNAMQWANRCISSLKESTITPDIFIVDNGSTDGTQEYIKTHFPSIIFRQSEKNLGFGRANNLGLQYALDHDYDYVYLLNQDAWVMPDTFEKLINVQKENPEYGILSPMQLQGNESFFDTNFRDLTLYKLKESRYILDDIYFNRRKNVYEVDFVMAAHWLISSNCLKKVGGFSPTFPHYGEDNNYIHRACYFNYKTGIVTNTSGIHDRAGRTVSIKQSMYYDYKYWLVTISNPLYQDKPYKYRIIRDTIHKVRKYKSFIPIKYCWRLLADYKKIINNKKTSIQGDRSFLEYQV